VRDLEIVWKKLNPAFFQLIEFITPLLYQFARLFHIHSSRPRIGLKHFEAK
jgi:hypothetical protein